MSFKRRDEIEAREGLDTTRLARRGGGSLLYSLIVIGVMLILFGINQRVNYQFDLTELNVNELSPQTLAVLAGLTEPVELLALYGKDEAAARESYWNLLRRYRAASRQVEYEFYDPIAQPGIVKELGLDTSEEGQRKQGLTVVRRGEQKVVFRGQTEEQVTNAILEVTREGRRVVGILRGYGEREPSSTDGPGFASAVTALQGEYYEVREVALAQGIPDDLTVLIAAGPQLPIPDAERARLADWLERGGRLLALLDPGERTGLNQVLDHWGLRATGDRVFDRRDNINNDPFFLKITDYSRSHETVRGFGANLPTALPEAGAVEHYEVAPDVFHADLASSSHFSMSLADDGTRTPGPLDVAAAAWRDAEVGGRPAITRIVLIGDSDFASQAYLPARANRNLFLNCVGWLTRQEELVSIRRQPLEGQTFALDGNERTLVSAAVLAAPALVVLSGIVMFLRRRSL